MASNTRDNRRGKVVNKKVLKQDTEHHVLNITLNNDNDFTSIQRHFSSAEAKEKFVSDLMLVITEYENIKGMVLHEN